MKIIEGTIASPKGFYADGQHCGLKRKRKDIGWIYSEVPASVAAVFTTNAVKAAPINVTKQAVANGQLQAIIVNSGNANACTGKQGELDSLAMQQKVAERFQIQPDLVAVASTGIIGQPLPMATVTKGILSLASEKGNAAAFHEAILTTDTATKELTVTLELSGSKVTIAGVAKGSGMIHPNMATMLSFITTDANISADLLQELLAEVTETTFNQITVDGDTSTNDMVIVLANGLAATSPLIKNTEEYQQFAAAFSFVAETLAKKIAQDGEGATKLIEVQVEQGRDSTIARMIAKKIVGSSLVKTAMFGEDPNWGRIICALGYADPDLNPEKVDIWLGESQVLQAGQPVLYNQEAMQKHLKQAEILIKVNVHQGNAGGNAWGCDLTYKYVEINALYHT